MPKPTIAKRIEKKIQDLPIKESDLALIPSNGNALDKPANDTQFAQAAAKLLVNIIKQNNWSHKLGGQSEHIQYEGWQTAGKYYGYTVETFDPEYIELGGAKGFKAKAVVINEQTGIKVGGAEAYCMSDEKNWNLEPHTNSYGKTVPGKPLFQLASMAQTRAGSKALRQILGFVVALAGYNPTPAEEMEGVVTNNGAEDSTKDHSEGSNGNPQSGMVAKPVPPYKANGSWRTEAITHSQIATIFNLAKGTGLEDDLPTPELMSKTWNKGQGSDWINSYTSRIHQSNVESKKEKANGKA